MNFEFSIGFLLCLSYVFCAPSSTQFKCPAVRRPRSNPPGITVEKYNSDIEDGVRNRLLTTISFTQPNMNHPIKDYTYKTTPQGINLPVRIRAFIRPRPYHHLKAPNSRPSDAVSNDAKKNCRAMGMLPNDHFGHLIPYILGGSSDWYNIVPQSQNVNTGMVTNTDLVAPSIWRQSEKEMQQHVQEGGFVDYQVLVKYDLPSTRPTGFGTIEKYFDANGALIPNMQCKGYWHSNDPTEDPDNWNG